MSVRSTPLASYSSSGAASLGNGFTLEESSGSAEDIGLAGMSRLPATGGRPSRERRRLGARKCPQCFVGRRKLLDWRLGSRSRGRSHIRARHRRNE